MMGLGFLVPILVTAALAYALGWLPPNQEQNLRQQKEKRTRSTRWMPSKSVTRVARSTARNTWKCTTT
jgi:hypothetical protein